MPSSERKLHPTGKPGPVVVTATVDESAYDVLVRYADDNGFLAGHSAAGALIREGLQQKGYLTA